MKHYPRAINRLILFLTGILLLSGGGLVVAAATTAPVREQWIRIGGIVEDWWAEVSQRSTVVGQDFSWMTIAVVALAVIIAVVALILIVTQGGGRASQLHDPLENDGGRTLVRTSFITDLVSRHAENHQWIHSISASSYTVGKRTMICLDVIAYKGASVGDLAEVVREMTDELDTVLGYPVAIYTHIRSGWQTAVTSRQRVK